MCTYIHRERRHIQIKTFSCISLTPTGTKACQDSSSLSGPTGLPRRYGLCKHHMNTWLCGFQSPHSNPKSTKLLAETAGFQKPQRQSSISPQAMLSVCGVLRPLGLPRSLCETEKVGRPSVGSIKTALVSAGCLNSQKSFESFAKGGTRPTSYAVGGGLLGTLKLLLVMFFRQVL